MSNDFWSFSVSIYDREGVAENCIAVQDLFGLDVNMLLYASWLAAEHRILTLSHLADLEDSVGRWRDQVIIPLRSLRTRLRDYPEAHTIRQEIKSLELRAEQRQQDSMWEFFNSAAALPVGNCPLSENLGLLSDARVADSDVWQRLVTCLAAAIGP